MGLDVSHGCWSASYSAFTRFRNELWLAAGYKLREEGYHNTPDIDWSVITDENIHGRWATMPDDPLYILVIHSDCDGIIPVEYCEPLAARLRQLIPSLPSEGKGHLGNGGSAAAARRFIVGLQLAAALNEDVGFY